MQSEAALGINLGVRPMSFRNSSCLLVLTSLLAIEASAAFAQVSRLEPIGRTDKESQPNTAAASSSGIEVTKTAFVNGENVCGVIRIKNTGRQPASVSAIADSLEVHFPSFVSPPAGLGAGSTR